MKIGRTGSWWMLLGMLLGMAGDNHKQAIVLLIVLCGYGRRGEGERAWLWGLGEAKSVMSYALSNWILTFWSELHGSWFVFLKTWPKIATKCEGCTLLWFWWWWWWLGVGGGGLGMGGWFIEPLQKCYFHWVMLPGNKCWLIEMGFDYFLFYMTWDMKIGDLCRCYL